MIVDAVPGSERTRRLAATFACVLIAAAGSAHADTVGSGFIARAQRAELVVIGRVTSFGVGLLGGCSHTIAVDRVLRGSLESESIELFSSFASGCPTIRMKGRLVLAIDLHPGSKSAEHPLGTSWRAVLDERDNVHGDLTRCHGVTVSADGRTATNEAERMPLRTLELLLTRPARPLCSSPATSTAQRTRTLEGRFVGASGAPARATLEFSPARETDGTGRISPGEDGRFRIERVTGGPVWLRATNDEFDPFLVPPGVRRVNVHSLRYPHDNSVFAPE